MGHGEGGAGGVRYGPACPSMLDMPFNTFADPRFLGRTPPAFDAQSILCRPDGNCTTCPSAHWPTLVPGLNAT